MNARMCLAALAGMCAGLLSHGHEVLVSRESQRIERWSVSDDGSKWEKRGDFLVAGKDVQPTGLARLRDVVYVGDAAEGGRIRLYGRDGAERGVLAPLGCRPDQLCVSPDGKWLYVTCLQKGVFRMSLPEGKPELFVNEPQAGMRGLAFGGDGLLYVFCRSTGMVHVYDVSGACPQLKGKIATRGGTGALSFFDGERLCVFGGRSMALDLVKSSSGFLGEEGLMVNAIGSCRLVGGVFVGDWTSGKIWRFDNEVGKTPVCVAQGVGQVCALVALDDQPSVPRPRSPLVYRTPSMPEGSDFERMSFNNPEAVTFLKGPFGTSGLYVYDYDGDGLKDIILRGGWSGKEWDGAYLFRNPGGGTDPVFPKAVSVGFETLPRSPSGKDVNGRPIPDQLKTNLCFSARQLVDYDGDGKDDLIIANGERRYAVAADIYDELGNAKDVQMRAFLYVCRYVSGEGEEVRYGEPEMVYMENNLPVETFGWFRALFGDWDGDGDLDIIANDFMDTLTFFENVGTRTKPVYTSGRFLRAPDGTRLHGDLCMSIIVKCDWDGDGRDDIMIGEEDSRVGWMRNTGRIEKGLPIFDKPRYFRQQADELNFGVLSTPAVFDMDGDGDEDIVSGNSHGQIAVIENLSGPGVEKPKWATPVYLREPDGNLIWIQAGRNGSLQGPCESKWGYSSVSVADWDGDGLPDVMANSIWGLVTWWRNVGTRAKPKFDFGRPVTVEWNGNQPSLRWGWLKPQHLKDPNALLTQWRTTPLMCDWNGDGLTDLLAMDVDGDLAFFERMRKPDGALVLKAPRKAFLDGDGKPFLLAYNWIGGPANLWGGRVGLSGRRKFCVCDWNGDGKLDLVMNAHPNADLWLQTESAGGTWRFSRSGSVAWRNLATHDPQPATCDFNGDGIPDLIFGAMDGYFYYRRNPRVRAKSGTD